MFSKLKKVLGVSVTAILLPAAAFANGSVSNGAVSGGGGGTLPANPVGNYVIEQIIKDAKQDLRLLIKAMYREYPGLPPNAVDKKVFLGPKTLFEVLEETGVEVRNDKACFDAAGNEVDGSIYATEPDDICISSFRIAPKLIKERARIETLALIVHELSHKLGTTETEAIDLQQRAAFSIEGTDEKTTFRLPQEVSNVAYRMSHRVEDLISALKDPAGELALFDKLVQAVTQDEYKLRNMIGSGRLDFYNDQEREWFGLFSYRLSLAMAYIGIKNDNANGYLKNEYLDMFNGQSSITYADFLAHRPSSREPNRYGGEMLYRLENDQQAVTEFEQIKKILSREAHYYSNFGHDLAIPRHQSGAQLQFNPFKQFVGTYKVGAVSCTAKNSKNPESAMPSTISLRETAVGEIFMDRRWNSRSATDKLDDDHSITITAGSVGTMSGSDQAGAEFGEIFSEYSKRWGDRWDRAWFRIEKRGSGLTLVQEQRTRSKGVHRIYESSYRCEAQLGK